MLDVLTLLVINSGSSSLRAGLFHGANGLRHWHYAAVGEHQMAFARLMADLEGVRLDGIVHRVVHGGTVTEAVRWIDEDERQRLQSIVDLAPLHLPTNLRGIDLCLDHFDVPQVACFDTAFHGTLSEMVARLPVPPQFGLRKYGFHGLSYASVARRLPQWMGETAQGRIVVMHLGHGSSACLLEGLRSVDTTMGYSPAGGMIMGTRSGDLDPGVMLALARRMNPAELEHTVFHRMGLLALSEGLSSDMQTLLADARPQASRAVEGYCRSVARHVAGMVTVSGGLDALVFTGGIGEHAAWVRREVIRHLAFLGFELDESANANHAMLLAVPDSLPILMVPADEEEQMRHLATELLESPRRAIA